MSKPKDNFFDRANRLIQNTEYSAVNLISSIAPWLAPLPVAFMTMTNMSDKLFFPSWISGATAATVEILGISAINTALLFSTHNRRYKADKNRVSLAIPIIAGVVYILIVLTVNVLLETTNPYAPMIARALLTLLSVPAALILAVRAQFTLTTNRITAEHSASTVQAVPESASTPASTVQAQTFKCKHCGEKFSTLQALGGHMKNRHGNGNHNGRVKDTIEGREN